MPRDGAVVLSDLRNPALSIVCEPCGRRGTWRRQADRSASDARQLSEGAFGQHPRSVQDGVRAAVAVNG
jgi:hypothetical protein